MLPFHALGSLFSRRRRYDDLSDEDAFAALPHGIAIRVGTRRSTRARYQLEGVGQVHHFLETLRNEFL